MAQAIGTPPKKDLQGRSWCVTLWSEEDAKRLNEDPSVKAIVIGKEVCPTTHKDHWQGYVRFGSNKRFSWWKREYPTAHVVLRRGTEQEAAEYCRKEGSVLCDRGCQVDVPQGDPTEVALEMIEQGAPLWQVYQANRKFFFHNYRKVKDIKEFIDSNKRLKRESTEQEQSDQTAESGTRTQSPPQTDTASPCPAAGRSD